MRAVFLTSGFPDGFTSEFIESIKDNYKELGRFVFITSSFEEHSKNEKYADVFIRTI